MTIIEQIQIRTLKGAIPVENIFFIIHFYAIMHRIIVQNKIMTIICSCLFLVRLIFIATLGKVRLGRPNPKQFQTLNFYLRRKKKVYSELYALQCIAV